MADRPVLVCMRGSLQGSVFPIPEGGLEIGRSPENDVVVDDDGVSRFHARLLYDNGSLWLRDAGSRNGIFVNDKRISDHKALKVGDVIRLGETDLEVRWEETEPDDPEDGGSSSADNSGTSGPAGRRRWFWPFE
ncbi:MAG: FHA domain-containing protein [Alphaproteobacteria bacterium]|nr:FHA domain-containing protein [Alphaproteobacteria bacterium]